MKVKICQLCAVDFTLQKFLLPLIDGLSAAKFDVTSVCSDGDYIDALRGRGYRIETIPIARNMNPFKHVMSIWRLYCFFRREKFDVVHVHTPVAALIGRIAASLARVPLIVYTAHGFYFHDNMPSWKRSVHVALERFSGRLTHLLFTQSSEDAEAAIQENIMPRDRVFAIGNGIDIQRFNPLLDYKQRDMRESFGIPDDAYVVTLIGRLVEEKGVIDFLNAATLLTEKRKNIYFVLVGERLSSDHAVAVDTVINEAKYSLRERLVMTGLRDDIPAMLSISDLFCLPSWREGMPRTIIEAMMMGLPVLATNIRGSREEVVEGVTGLLVPVRSPDKLADAMLRCSSQIKWSKKLGDAGRERALQLYDESKVVALQIDHIRRITSQASTE